MEAAIYMWGYAVSIKNFTNTVISTSGILLRFKYLGEDYRAFYQTDFYGPDKDKPKSNYYKHIDYGLYQKGTISKAILESRKFDVFQRAKGTETLVFRKPYYKPVKGSYKYYAYRLYTAKAFEKGTNFFKSGKLVEELFSISEPMFEEGANPSLGFFTNHITLVSDISDEADKEEFVKTIVGCAIRIDMIVNYVKPILTKNLTGTDLVEMKTFWKEIELEWMVNLFSVDFQSLYFKGLISALATFYENIDNNESLLEDDTLEERIWYMLSIMTGGLLEALSSINRINYIKKAFDEYKSTDDKVKKEEKVRTILKLMDSINITDQSKVDDFLDLLVNPENAVMTSVYEYDPEVDKLVKRERITLFEAIVKELDSSLAEKVWDYSSAGKRINAAWGWEMGHAAQTAFVMKVYTIWALSKYNPVRFDVFNQNYYGFIGQNTAGKTFKNYSTQTATTFQGTNNPLVTFNKNIGPPVIYVTFRENWHLGKVYDTSGTQFAGFDKVYVGTDDWKLLNGTPSIGLQSMIQTLGIRFPIGYYHLYQAIQVVYVQDNETYVALNHSWTDGVIDYTQVCIPSFLYLYIDTNRDMKFIIENLSKAIYTALKNTSKLLKSKKLKEFIDGIEKAVDIVENIGNLVVLKSEIDYIKNYANSCSSSDNFCAKINTLSFWLEAHVLAPGGNADLNSKLAAISLVNYATLNSWPSEFTTTPDGIAAKNFITNLVTTATSYSEIDRVNDILAVIYDQIAREEPKTITGDGNGFSLYKWNKANNKYTKTSVRQLSEIEMNDLIEFALNQKSLPDSWIIGIIFKAFRIKKPQNENQVETALTNAANFIKPTSLSNGRGSLHYCFHDTNQREEFEGLLLSNFITRYKLEDHIKDNFNKLNTKYGGSVHTKTLPPDVDMVSYISNEQMLALYNQQLVVLRTAFNSGIITKFMFLKRVRLLKNSFKLHGRVNQGHIYAIVNQLLFKMGDEWKRFNLIINGVEVNLLNSIYTNIPLKQTDSTRLHLDPNNPIESRLDFVFFTHYDAANGRSIQPETQATFD